MRETSRLFVGIFALSLCLASLAVAAAAVAVPSPASTATKRTYHLTVIDGEGSGEYRAGVRALITARPPRAGETFAQWSFVPDGLTMDGGVHDMALTFYIPDEPVTATARYYPLPPSKQPEPSPEPSPVEARPDSARERNGGYLPPPLPK